MGACASKPKVLKSEMDTAPAPESAPEVVAKDLPAGGEIITGGETKEIVEDVKEVEQEEEKKVLEADEDADKRRSLGILFKENEGKESSANEQTQTETVQPEPVKEAEVNVENPPKESNTVAVEAEKIETRTEEPVTVVASVETQKVDQIDEKRTEEEKKVVATPQIEEKNPVEAAPAIEPAKVDKVEEKKTEIVSAVPATEKLIEVAPSGENVKHDDAKPTEKVENVKHEGVVVEDVKAVEKVSTSNVKQEEPILPVSSTEKVVEEVPKAK